MLQKTFDEQITRILGSPICELHMKMSLIITTYNREDALNVVLKSVAKQTLLPDEILIADDGSTQATAEVIRAHQKILPIPLIHCHHPDLGFRVSHIRNKAIRNASGDYIILTEWRYDSASGFCEGSC